MKRKILTIKQISAAGALELRFRLNCLHADSINRSQDAGVPKRDIWEAVAIVKELRRRLGRLGIFYLEVKNEKIIKKRD